MASGSSSRIIRSPGKIVVGPTNLSTAYPYGGIEIGQARVVTLSISGVDYRVQSEGIGNIGDVLSGPKRVVFSCFLRGWDDSAIKELWSEGYTLGSVSGHSVWSYPGTSLVGSSRLSVGKVILFVPNNTVAHPAVLIYRGIPDWSDSTEIAFSLKDEMGLPLVVECVQSSSGKVVQSGRIVDLSL